MMNNRFDGKNVLVIGGNSGIGLATAKAFFHEGANLIITGRNAETLASSVIEMGERTSAYQCDVSDMAQIKDLVAKVKVEFGHIDALFFSAGVCSFCSIDSVTEEDWYWTMDTNLKGMFFTIQGMLPLMANPSSIVLAGSIAGRLAVIESPVYAASKAGVRSLARSLAANFVSKGIRVNVVSPGPTDTPAFRELKGKGGTVQREMWEKELNSIPMKRLAKPEEVAKTVLFLASSESSFTTGAEILVDGGEVYLA